MTILAGLGYAGVVAFNWERLVGMGADQSREFTEKDLLQCEPGTHQQNGRCVSNPAKSVAVPAASKAARPAPK